MERLAAAWVVPGDPDTGLMCDTCQRPTAMRFPMALLTDHSAEVAPDNVWCPEHESVQEAVARWFTENHGRVFRAEES